MIGWIAGVVAQLGLILLKLFGVIAWSWWFVLAPVGIVVGLAVLFCVGLLLQGAVGRNPFQ